MPCEPSGSFGRRGIQMMRLNEKTALSLTQTKQMGESRMKFCPGYGNRPIVRKTLSITEMAGLARLLVRKSP